MASAAALDPVTGIEAVVGFEPATSPAQAKKTVSTAADVLQKTRVAKAPGSSPTGSAVSLAAPQAVTSNVKLIGLAGFPKLSVDPVALRDLVYDSRLAIEELKTIAELADKMGFEVYLLGGMAGNLYHHLRQKTLSGDPQSGLRPEHFEGFDLDRLMNRATQDIDLVIARKNGTPETYGEIMGFRDEVKTLLPGLEVDVRGLRTARDDVHLPLLNNSAFLNEDHNTIDYLMVHLNATDREHVVRDLADWDNPASQNIVDCANGAIRVKGDYPNIKTALRLLIKATRHSLQIDESSFGKLKDVATHFDPKHVNDPVLSRWLGKNVAKLVVDAQDLEATWDLLCDVGLLEKLRRLPFKEVAALFDKEPLRSEPVGDSRWAGKTAAELGITCVTHNTKDLSTYRAITNSPTGQPNFFISRGSASGEVALFGDGLYTMEGRQSGSGGHSITCSLDPDARQGTDFRIVNESFVNGLKIRWVVILNRAKIHLVYEKLSLSNQEMIEAWLNPSNARKEHLLEYFPVALARRTLSDADKKCFFDAASALIDLLDENNVQFILATVFAPSCPLFKEFPALTDKFIDCVSQADARWMTRVLLNWGQCPQAKAFLRKAADQLGADYRRRLASDFFGDPTATYFKEELEYLVRKRDYGFYDAFMSHTSFGPHCLELSDQIALMFRECLDVRVVARMLDCLGYIRTYAPTHQQTLENRELVDKLRALGRQRVAELDPKLAARYGSTRA